jgi:hypothetical protein
LEIHVTTVAADIGCYSGDMDRQYYLNSGIIYLTLCRPFIYKYYAQKGYITNYASDDCTTAFWWNRKHTDHAILKKAFCTFKGFDPYSIRPHCVDNRLAHEFQLDYIQQFWETYKDFPKASFHWFSEGT